MNTKNNNSETKRGNILFINPLFNENNSEINIEYENSLLYLAAIAEDCEYNVRIANYKTYENLLSEIQNFFPDYIVSIISFKSFKEEMKVLALLKEQRPNTKIIVTGIPFLTYNTNVTYENSFIDYVIYGEAEITLKEILEGVKDSDILGICYSDENMQPVKNKPRPFIDDLDILPFPSRHLLGLTDRKEALISISRGCKNSNFCSLEAMLYGENVRIRSIPGIISEITECVSEYRIKNFILKSDPYIHNSNWTKELCQRIIDSGLNIIWSTNILPEDKVTAALMKNSGCKSIFIDIQSGSDEILKNIGSHIKIDNIKKCVKLLKQNKLKIYSSFMFGYPWETEKTAEETIKFALELNSDYTKFMIAAPFPGTRFFAYSMMNKLFSGNPDFKNAYSEPIVRAHDLSKERILAIYNEAQRRYYFRPQFILKSILGLRDLNELNVYVKIYRRLLIKCEKHDK